LARHQLILDPDGLTYVERLTRANNDGWNVPQWLLSDDKDAVP